MATQFTMIEYIMEQIASTGEVSFKKMFGEYMIYLNAKPVFIICDNTLFVKVLPASETIMKDSQQGLPYPSCKQAYYIVDDIDDKELLCTLALALEKVIAVPKPKKKKINIVN